FSFLIFAATVFAGNEFKNHPLVEPLEGSVIRHQQNTNFGEYKLALGVVKEKKIEKVEDFVGKLCMTTYRGTKENSTFEIFTLMKDKWVNDGFKVLFECKKDECKDDFAGRLYRLNPYQIDRNFGQSIPLTKGKREFSYYLAAQKGNVYVSLFATHGWEKVPLYRIDVIEPKTLKSIKPPESAQLKAKLDKEGKINLAQIEFSSKSEKITKTPDKTLQEIGKMLKENPGVKFLVVGHCNELADFKQNQQLSQKRAQAVVDRVVKEFGFPAERLKAVGTGQLSPVSGINPEKNNRIELVKYSGEFPKEQVSKPDNILGDVKPLNIRTHKVNKTTRSTTPSNIPDFKIKHEASLAAQAQKEGESFETSAQQAAVETPEPEKIKEPKKKHPQIKIPNLIGKRKLAAKNVLKKMSLKANCVGKTFGKVKKQNPLSGTMVDINSTVTLTIGK
ncbi:MAG: OmpA family protein, partial [Candidatus Rifleibacteriota bacterium]